tara:strand:- start:776 stop:1135 length:360 start_codon:yes stop_codon:yes gene_type:complete
MTMQIILGKEHAESIREKYIVLELDTFKMQDEYVPSYCILDAGAIPLSEMQELPLWQENHQKLIENYRKQNWDFCEQMIDHISPKWGGSVASFYITLYGRIQELKSEKLGKDWDWAQVK